MRDRIMVSLVSTALVTTSLFAVFTPAQEALAAEEGAFQGNWIASGKRRLLDFAPDREVFTFELEGHVNLEDNVGEVRDFWSECVGLWDSQTGGTTRCVWRGLEGNEVYSVLSGQLLHQGVEVTGEFVGGTGTAAGIEGTFTFTWSSVFFNEDERVLTGHTRNLAGSYRIP